MRSFTQGTSSDSIDIIFSLGQTAKVQKQTALTPLAKALKEVDMANILVINGPNLNLLGNREPNHYGSNTLQSINESLVNDAQQLGHSLSHFQSNAEAELINRIHQAKEESVAFILINPAAYTHTSVALRDALAGVAIPFIEIHLSNVHAREAFRKESYFSDIAVGVITGLGARGYHYALLAANDYLQR